MTWRWPSRKLSLLALALAAALGALVVTVVIYSAVELARFGRAEARRAALVYAAPQVLAPGVDVRAVGLVDTLGELRYTDARGTPTRPGQFHRAGDRWDIYTRAFPGSPAQRVSLEVHDGRIARVTRDGHDVGAAALEPEVLTSAEEHRGEEFRPVRLADVPPVLVQAVLAAEDHRFFAHSGLDVRALFRAAWANVRAGHVAQGGSTITQQLVKNRLLSPRRTFRRKVDEAWLAGLVELRYSKQQILEAYLNDIYLGQRGALAIRGVGAAARAYFGKDVHDLTLPEAALLAGMIRAPNHYSPAASPARARERRDVVLARMRELGMIHEADEHAAREVAIRVPPSVSGQRAPYFVDYVRRELEQRVGDEATGAGVTIVTTLDPAMQRFAERAVSRGLDRLESRYPRLRRRDPAQRLQAALVALDPATGEIRALVGGRDYQTSQYDRAILAKRQPGSAFKPFVYLAALRPRGGPPALTAASIVDDTPITIDVDGRPWTPRNYEDRYEGRVSVRRALEESLNAATVRVAQSVGLPAVVETAHALGLEDDDLQPVPALALGAFEVTPLELARAYLPFANAGTRPPGPVAVRAVFDRDGPLDVPADAPQEVITPAEAYLITSLLEGVVREGTASAAGAAGLPAPVAGKTGTTNDGRDAWFAGYASGLLTVAWVGFDDSSPHGLSGAQAALPIWIDFMKQALEAYPQTEFAVPPGITFAQIDATNGKLANRFCPVVRRETFLAGTLPPPCDEHGGLGDQVRDWWRRFRDWLGH